MKKEYGYKKIRIKVRNLVKKACYSKNNKFSEESWDYHIVIVVDYSLKLGKKLKADLEILELAALLHDYAGICNEKFSKEHHIHGARLAEKVLQPFNYPQDKITHIKECILNHRGSRKRVHKSIESKILASADAMSHFSQIVDMLHFTYQTRKLGTKKGAVWLKEKLKRSWKKIMPEGKKMIREDYEIAMKVLNRAIDNKN